MSSRRDLAGLRRLVPAPALIALSCLEVACTNGDAHSPTLPALLGVSAELEPGFGRSMELHYGFHNAAALSAFAALADTNSEIATQAHWGAALTLGPTLNSEMD